MAKTFISAQADVASLTNDPLLAVGASNNALNQTLINMGVQYVMKLADWNFNRTSIDITSVASQQSYVLPYNIERMNYVNVYANGIWYTPREIKDGRIWRQINYVTTNYTDVPQYWHYSNNSGKIDIYPIPASAGNTIRAGYTKKLRDLSETAGYSTGKITTVADSNVLTGIGTTFTPRMVGASLKITSATTQTGDFWYEINSYTSATVIGSKNNVPVTIVAPGASYTINEMIPFAEGYENIATWFACDKYYQMREMPEMAKQYEQMWKETLEEMKARDQRSVNGVLKKESSLVYLDPNADPWAIRIYPLP
jgi:hypothetical protein